MSAFPSNWIRVAALSDVPLGEAKAVKLAPGRSIALFNVDGRVYATDNQCPHMGYPLTRGAVRHGVLTCDWHGRSFDLEGAITQRSSANAASFAPFLNRARACETATGHTSCL